MKRIVLTTGIILIVWLMPTQAEDESADSLYRTTLAQERILRTPGKKPKLSDYRAVIVSYSTVAKLFPQNSYADHALWHATGLAIEAFNVYRERQDFETGIKLLKTLLNNNPKSQFVGRSKERRDQLNTLAQIGLLNSIRRETRANLTRVTIKLDREVQFKYKELKKPNQLLIDFSDTELSPKSKDSIFEFLKSDEIVRFIRIASKQNRITSLILNTENADTCQTFTLYDPFRLIVDCRRYPLTTNKDFFPPPFFISPTITSVSRFQPKLEQLRENKLKTDQTFPNIQASNLNEQFSLAQQLGLGLSRIVIDAGHGGHDPGARAHGLNESDLVLDIALRLEQRLKSQPELEVIMTRSGNDYVPLKARTALANKVEADLFVSIHANASRKSQTRGVETYFLNLSIDQNAESLAARENSTGMHSMNELRGLLQAIATNSKLEESRDLAKTIQEALVRDLRAIDPEIPDLGVKQAPFIVLIGAQMPSILVEVSFVSNSSDASLLSKDGYRERIAEALFNGITNYQNSLNSTKILALQVNK